MFNNNNLIMGYAFWGQFPLFLKSQLISIEKNHLLI